MYRGRAGALVVALGVLALGCEASEHGAPLTFPRRFDPLGTVALPERPFLPGELPAGWHVQERVLNGGSAPFPSTEQVLFMPPRSTPSSGPALLAGYVSDEEWGPDSCDPPTDPVHGVPSGAGGIVRWGHGFTTIPVAGPSYITTDGAYVFGRDVDDADLRRAAASVVWPARPTEAPPYFKTNEPPTMQLPRGFTMRASGDLAAHEQPVPAIIRLRAGPERWISIGQEEASTAGVFLADFWRSVTKGQRCGGPPVVDRTIIRDDTVIRIEGPDTPAVRRAMTQVEAGLHRVSQDRFGGTPPSPAPSHSVPLFVPVPVTVTGFSTNERRRCGGRGLDMWWVGNLTGRQIDAPTPRRRTTPCSTS